MEYNKGMISSTQSLTVAYHPPFAWNAHLRFLKRRAIAGVEKITNEQYARTVSLIHENKRYVGWITVRNDKKNSELVVTISQNLIPVTEQVLTRVRQLFDTSCSPSRISEQLGPLATSLPGLRVPGAFNGFEMAVRAILGQQITVTGARTLAGRIVQAFGYQISTPIQNVDSIFPSPEEIVDTGPVALTSLGITRKRAQTIYDLAKALAEKKLTLNPNGDSITTLNQLRAIKGIGEWTTQYIAMRVLSLPDAFVHTDYGVQKALSEKRPAAILKIAEKWQPWRAYATMYLWNSLAEKEMHV